MKPNESEGINFGGSSGFTFTHFSVCSLFYWLDFDRANWKIFCALRVITTETVEAVLSSYIVYEQLSTMKAILKWAAQVAFLRILMSFYLEITPNKVRSMYEM